MTLTWPFATCVHSHICISWFWPDLQLFSRFAWAEENGAGFFSFSILSVFAGFKNSTADKKSLFHVWIVSINRFRLLGVCVSTSSQKSLKPNRKLSSTVRESQRNAKQQTINNSTHPPPPKQTKNKQKNNNNPDQHTIQEKTCFIMSTTSWAALVNTTPHCSHS